MLLLGSTWLTAQDLGNSPYSRIGLGDLLTPAFVHQEGMGGTGVSYSLPFYINNINPALLTLNRRTVLDVGLIGQIKISSDRTSTQRDIGGSLGHLALAFPVSKRISTSLGIAPYSSVSFENQVTQNVVNSDFTSNVTFRGSGGLSYLFVATGVELLGGRSLRPDTLNTRLSLGLKVNYFFGSTIDETISQLNSSTQDLSYNVNFYQRDRYNGFIFEPGISFTQRLGKKYKFHLGGAYLVGQNLKAERFTSINRSFSDPSPDNSDNVDTLASDIERKVQMPSRLTLGLSLEKLDERSTFAKWVVSAEVSLQDWSELVLFDQNQNLDRRLVASVGAQFIPDFTAIRPGFWRRTIYRVGARYIQTPISLNGEQVDDLSVSLGFSVPFGRSSTSLNLSLVGGQRGTISDALIQERYLQVFFGITINDNWFVKPKYD
ncbi:MAG: hypothetical protein HC880_01810 [Bacteroidia bacterium]|nr:hypothetical protein [Bacteroidia bacterium]